MENSVEQLAKELTKDGATQAKIVLIALALYEMFMLGKKAWQYAKELRM